MVVGDQSRWVGKTPSGTFIETETQCDLVARARSWRGLQGYRSLATVVSVHDSPPKSPSGVALRCLRS